MGAFNGLGWQAFKKPGMFECLGMAFFSNCRPIMASAFGVRVYVSEVCSPLGNDSEASF